MDGLDVPAAEAARREEAAADAGGQDVTTAEFKRIMREGQQLVRAAMERGAREGREAFLREMTREDGTIVGQKPKLPKA